MHVLSGPGNNVVQANDVVQPHVLPVHHPVEELQRLVSRSVGVEHRDVAALGQGLGQAVLKPASRSNDTT